MYMHTHIHKGYNPQTKQHELAKWVNAALSGLNCWILSLATHYHTHYHLQFMLFKFWLLSNIQQT